ncbi:hypothetical protein V2J09_016637 [Rumex salicifolius]
MADQETQIQVRTLTGDAIPLSISPDKTIHDLKLLLLRRFSPAIASPSFHLFFRGVKLGLKTQVGSQQMNSDEFFVLVPFTKKGSGVQGKNTEYYQPKNSKVSLAPRILKLAQSVWSEMREGVSSLGNAGLDVEGLNYVPTYLGSSSGKKNDTVASRKRTRQSGGNKEDSSASDAIISIILQSVRRNVMDDDVCQSFNKVLESANCFSDAQSEKCMILSKPNLQSLGREKSVTCACPPWLKVLMKTFAFLNIFSGFMLAQLQKLTVDNVRIALDKLSKLSVGVTMEDLNHLSLIFPQVVSFFNNEAQSNKPYNMLITINLLGEHDGNSVTTEKRTPLSRIINLLKKREAFFRKNLQDVLEYHMYRTKDRHETPISLEEFITSAKEISSTTHPNIGKQPRRSFLETSKSYPTQRQCNETHPLSPLQVVEHLRNRIGAQGQIVHVEEISGRVASFSDIPDELSENVKSSLQSLGISKLYSHQADSVRASISGQNVVVATTTSSGKSLCYNLPVLEVMTKDMLSCALYLFPTKALAQDQLRALCTMTEGFGSNLTFGIYDGDTSQPDRIWLRDNARLLITNPDMLHMSILPFHRQFQRILSNLRFVVIDEAHIYKGPFGCHTSLILRRLLRICSHVYGSDPSFVLCTATSTNPCQHAMNLANLSTLEFIQKDGSPSGPKQFVLWNPPLHPMHIHGKNSGSQDSKQDTTLLRRSSREILNDTAPHLMDSVGSYRSGYVAKDRRRIESDFFGGKICGIAATNALELGIDVGEIDVTLHLGFPGSVASLWQQAGRSGRRGRPSVAVYIAFEGPLDQYFMKFPEKLFRSPIECCHVDAQNPQVLQQHLLCASVEHPLSLMYDEKYFGSGLKDSIMLLANMGNLTSNLSSDYSASIWSYIGKEKIPARAISIRAIESERFKVINKENDEVLEEIEESRAFFQVYEGAVYLNQGNIYLVQELNLSSKIAICQRADLKYYTKTRDYTDIDVIGGDTTSNLISTTAQAHSCSVTTTWFGFFRIWKRSNEIFDTVELSLPKFTYESQAVWVRVPESVKIAVNKKNLAFHAGLHAASHAVLNVVPLYVICNSTDLAPECVNPHDTRYMPERVLLYDKHPGGSGLSNQIQPVFSEMLNSALELLTSCQCTMDTGCPNCVQSLACHEYNEVLHKEAAIMIIKGVLEYEKSCFGGVQSHAPSETAV